MIPKYYWNCGNVTRWKWEKVQEVYIENEIMNILEPLWTKKKMNSKQASNHGTVRRFAFAFSAVIPGQSGSYESI